MGRREKLSLTQQLMGETPKTALRRLSASRRGDGERALLLTSYFLLLTSYFLLLTSAQRPPVPQFPRWLQQPQLSIVYIYTSSLLANKTGQEALIRT